MKLRKIALDCMMSRRFARALNALYGDAGFEFTLVEDLVPAKTSDEHWSDVFKKFGGEFVLSGDTKIAYKPQLACAFVDNGFVSVFIQPPWQSLPFHLQIAYLVYWWPAFARNYESREVGTLWRAPCSSNAGAITLKLAELTELKVPREVLDKARVKKTMM